MNASDGDSYVFPGRDVSNEHAVLSGWTASDLVGTVKELAEFTFEVYAPQHNRSDSIPPLISRASQLQMLRFGPTNFYGFATL